VCLNGPNPSSTVGSIAARALEFAILTASRFGEVRGARREEINADATVWTVPASRIKGGKEHRVPLSSPAQSIPVEMRECAVDDLVFPGHKVKRPLMETWANYCDAPAKAGEVVQMRRAGE
jgi:integrase